MNKIIIPKGTRDFSLKEIRQRNYIIKVIKNNFELFGFFPIETPAFEMLNVLNKKYGSESDKLIFKILNSGSFLKKDYQKYINDKDVIKLLSEKALRYDLTVPLVRYLTMHINKIKFPFKRYQIQPVWRADRPQKGRFREFYQCDADIISYSKSLWQEIELINIYEKVFNKLNIPIIIQINHRGIIYGLAKILGINGSMNDFIISLDKLEKIGIQAVKEEIEKKYKISLCFNKLIDILKIQGNFIEKLTVLNKYFICLKEAKQAIEDLIFIYNALQKILDNNKILKLNISLARGLNYYTGLIFEIKSEFSHFNFSIAGGGRYDSLISAFGLKNIYGVGISFGLDRISLIMKELNLFPNIIEKIISKIMFINFGNKETLHVYKILNILRFKYKISSELYPECVKIKKQLKYAYDKGILFVAIVGNSEIEKNIIKIKNLNTGIEYEHSNIESLINQLNK